MPCDPKVQSCPSSAPATPTEPAAESLPPVELVCEAPADGSEFIAAPPPNQQLASVVRGGEEASGAGGYFTTPSGLRYRFEAANGEALAVEAADPEPAGLKEYRAREVREVIRAFDAGEPVVAVVGFTGTGKTSIATEVEQLFSEERGQMVECYDIRPTFSDSAKMRRSLLGAFRAMSRETNRPDLVVLDEALDPPPMIVDAVRDFVAKGGRVLLLGGGLPFNGPQGQLGRMEPLWSGLSQAPRIVSLPLKPLNRRQVAELLSDGGHSFSPDEIADLTEVVLHHFPPYLSILSLLALRLGSVSGDLQQALVVIRRVYEANLPRGRTFAGAVVSEPPPFQYPVPGVTAGEVSDEQLFSLLMALGDGFEELHHEIRQRRLPLDHPVLGRFLRSVRNDDRFYSEEAVDIVGQLRFEEYFFRTERRLASYFATPSVEDTVYRLGDLGETERGEFIPLILSHVAQVLRDDPDPAMKDHALRLVTSMIRRDLLAADGSDDEAVKDLLFTGLADRDPAVLFWAWWALLSLASQEASAVTATSLSSEPSAALTSSPDFGLPRYSHPSQAHQLARFRLLRSLRKNQTDGATVSLREVIPVHSLADFHPDGETRQEILAEKMGALRRIVTVVGTDRPHEVMGHFLSLVFQPVRILRLPSGRMLVMDGHHRLAALYQAVRLGLIPREWLTQVGPVLLEEVTGGPVPEAVIERILTHGVQLTWDDLLPPLTPHGSGGGGGEISYRGSGETESGTPSDDQSLVPNLLGGATQVYPALGTTLGTRGSPVLTDGKPPPVRYLP